MAREREVKLAVADSFAVPDLGGVLDRAPDPPVTAVHRDRYHDTSDLRLARWGAALRHRDAEGWVVKLPSTGSGDVFDREEVTFAGTPGEPPAAAVGLVRSFGRAAPLEVVAGIETERTVRRWRDVAGATIVELCDDRVSIERGGEAHRFRELEVELAPDVDDRVLDAIAEVLVAAGAARGQQTTKLGRAIGPLGPPDVVEPELGDRPTAGDVIQAAIARSTRTMFLHLPVARLGVDPEGVHKSRVATRRLRSDLRTFENLVKPKWRRRLRSELRWFADVLGDVRDVDVLGPRLEQVVADRQIDAERAAPVLDALHQRGATARARMIEAMDGDRLPRLLDRLVVASADPKTTSAADAPAVELLGRPVRRQWKQLRRSVERLPADPAETDLHRVRILAKRARYAADAVAPAFGPRAHRFSKLMTTIQDELGELNDAAVAVAWLERAAEQLDPAGREVAGELAAALTAGASVVATRWRRAYERATEPEMQEWFR